MNKALVLLGRGRVNNSIIALNNAEDLANDQGDAITATPACVILADVLAEIGWLTEARPILDAGSKGLRTSELIDGLAGDAVHVDHLRRAQGGD